MQLSDKRTQAVMEQIKDAFRDAPHPGREVEAVIVERLLFADRLEAAEFFKDNSWPDIAVRDLRRYDDVLGCLTPAAFRHIIPAYMLAFMELTTVSPYYYRFCDDFLRHFDPREMSRSRAEAFTPEQNKAIRAFLEWCRDTIEDGNRFEMAKLLELYWSKV